MTMPAAWFLTEPRYCSEMLNMVPGHGRALVLKDLPFLLSLLWTRG